GHPVANTRMYVLDDAGEPVPVGVAGELYIGGVQVSRGYLRRPELTAERFVADGFGAEPGARLYRTGDLGRWRADGSIEYLGRTDFQVKVRGFRIELGEIEARLAEHADVREAAVLARADAPGDARLVAYYVAAEAVEVDALRAHLLERLPEHMVPAAYVRLDALPLTANGKIDRRALPAPDAEAYSAREYEAPASEMEIAVAAIWADVLRVERVGRHDAFFALGGHSLLAVQVISRVRRGLRVEVALGDVFARPVLADFAAALETAAHADLPSIQPAERGRDVPLSFAQQRLWFLEQLGGMGAAYHIPRRLRLTGTLDRDALGRALDRIVARHEALRTTFAEVAGAPVQRVGPADTGFALAEHDLRAQRDGERALDELVSAEARAPFDLERGPLIRGLLAHVAADDHVLLLTMHHIVSDAWSMGVLVRELGTLYGAFTRGEADPLPPLPVQYADYAVWQRSWIDGAVLDAQASYWRATLGGAPELLELPTDRPRPARVDHAGAMVRLALDAELTEGLKALGRRNGTTLFMTLMAGWAVVLGRLAGQEDVVVGIPTANRGRTEIEGLIGFFVNTLAVRVDLAGSPGVAEVLRRVKARSLEVQQNQDIPFEQVVELVQPARSLAHTPLFQVMFAWQNTPGGRLELPGLELGSVRGDAHDTAKFDLSLSLGEAGGRIVGGVTYATSIFDAATVERFAGYLVRVLEQMVADDARPVDGLALLRAGERTRIVDEWNATGAEYPRELCIHELIQARVSLAPDAVALVFDGGALTYRDVNARANRLARHLRGLGVGPDARVAICVERGVEMVVGLLAVLKAGGAYVPLDPAYPADRLEFMLADSAPAVVLTQATLGEEVDSLFRGVPVLRLDAVAPAWAGESSDDPELAGLSPDNLAYIIYTSGSTGRPKGVLNTHRNVVNRVTWGQSVWKLAPGEAMLSHTSLGFDGSLRELVWPLTVGARVVLADAGPMDPRALAATLRREGVSTLNVVPALLQLLVDTPEVAECTALRQVLCGGDALPEALLRRVGEQLPGVAVHNLYGPSEAATALTAVDCAPGTGVRVPIGRPTGNVRVYVLDGAGEPVPAGVAGELFIGGAGVARGYLRRPGLTAERFVPDAFGAEPGARVYRTGDLARWRTDGRVEFVGRNDFQVKVRGFRVELGEIEARLAEHPDVREAVVIAREDTPGDQRLVAYCLGVVDAAALRAHLAERLPAYMVPAAYVRLDALPLGPTGKVDRRALPAPESAAYVAKAYEPPAGDAEAALAEIWSEVLGVERVGRGDDFFELGGHSLLAVRVISRVREVLAVRVALGDVFVRPVLRDFAGGLEQAAYAVLPPILPADRRGGVPLSFAQQRLWFLEEMGGLGPAYHIARRLRMTGELDRHALRRALDRIVARHEALRTTFTRVDGEPVQQVAPVSGSAFALAEHDLGGHAGAEAELARLIHEEARTPFDLAAGPLIRGRLIRLAADEHVLILTMHHIVSDGWSMGVLIRELSALYGAFRAGEPDALPPLAVQYADYAAWQRGWIEGAVLAAHSAYWRDTLAGAPERLELPADHARPTRVNHAGATLGVVLDEELATGLRALSRRHGTTLFMTLLAGWATVLGRLAGQSDVVIGIPTANRGRTETEGLIGFFVNTLAIRVELAGSPTTAELLRRVKERTLGAQHHQELPFEQVVELVQPARSLSHHPLFQVMFSWQGGSGGRLELPGLALGGVGAPAHVTAKFDLSLAMSEAGGRIVGEVEYATSLFERATVERYMGYFRRVLREMVAAEDSAIDRHSLLPPAEHRRVVEEWNATDAAYPAGSSIHALFEVWAQRAPDAVAMVFGDAALTYGDLNARANRLAHHLRERGVGPDARVAICVERGVEMMVGLLAVLKAGGAYVPLDPAYPEDRLRYMLDDSAPVILLTEAALDGLFDGIEIPVIHLSADAAEWAGQPAADLAPVGAGELAYVIYTSGSTGQPKGVMVEHRGVVNLLRAMGRMAGMEPEHRLLSVTTMAFDIAALEFYLPLTRGARTVVLDLATTTDPARFGAAMVEHGATHLQATPATWRMLVEAGWTGGAGLRALCGGEALSGALAAQLRERVGALWNVYGPTETTIWSSAHPIAEGAARATAPIGRPIANTRIYILDGAGNPVPVGVAGELFIGGAGVARGYLRRPALTAERFVADPFSAQPGARMYRTGDLGRWLPDGTIEYAGRNDHQVKVRGHRIELGEIEARLCDLAAVRQAVVVAREYAPGDTRLVAYYVGADAEVETLRAGLAERLPEYMVPAAYVRLGAMPLTPNGKVNRRALPAPEGDAYATPGYEPPVGETETALAGIWADVLGVERVGRRDHFFELGGHSLLAVRVISRIRQQLAVEVALGDVFAHPVLRDFAGELARATHAALPAIVPVARVGDLPLSFAQQRLWFLEQLGGMGATYHIPGRLRLAGELDRGALARALDRIVARHEALRTTFAEVDGAPVQRISAEGGGFVLAEHDLSGEPDALHDLIAEEASTPFDLAAGPLIRGRLVRVGHDDHVLLLTMHHIVSDAWSMGVLIREMNVLYEAFRGGEPDPLPPLAVQYADYAAWQRGYIAGEVLEAHSTYWRDTLAGIPELLELPTDHARPARVDHAGGVVRLALNEELTAGLKALGRRHGTTLFMTLLAGWATVLARLSGQRDVVIGTPTANRGRTETEGLIGFFVNTLAVRVNTEDAPTVAELLARVKARTLGAQQHQELPFEQVVELVQPVRSLAHHPLFQVMFGWQNTPGGRVELAGLTRGGVGAPEHGTAKFDLSLALHEAGTRIVGGLTYATALFERGTAERYAGYLVRVLEQMVADDARAVDRVALVAPPERTRLLTEWNATGAAYPRESCIHELVEAQAARTPNAVALVFEGTTLTYREVNRRANQLAHHLRGLGVRPDTRVAISVERSLEMTVGLLAILKAGGAYVPLDPSYPADRLRFMLEDSAPVVLLTQERLRGELATMFGEVKLPVLFLDATLPAWAGEPVTDPAREGVSPENLAYIIYTSGSTGRPKGVLLEHRAMVNRLMWMQELFGLGATDAMLQNTSFSF
ncbi:MAG TPA: amino acid adenylation domain-containing protein, partial [Longimicrobium sp.]|nr:amino acid adenylation domain-containing protein [Longimicrobium sp.]